MVRNPFGEDTLLSSQSLLGGELQYLIKLFTSKECSLYLNPLLPSEANISRFQALMEEKNRCCVLQPNGNTTRRGCEKQKLLIFSASVV